MKGVPKKYHYDIAAKFLLNQHGGFFHSMLCSHPLSHVKDMSFYQIQILSEKTIKKTIH